jgi:hypothetical protein
MPTPKSDQIAAWFESALASIVGDGGTTYYYTPDESHRVEQMHVGLLRTELDLAYYVRQAEDILDERATRAWDVSTDFYVTGIKKYDGVNRNSPELPKTGDTPEVIQNKMIHDVLKRILTKWYKDVTVPTFIENIESLLVDRSVQADGFVIIQIHFVVRWSFVEDGL